MQFRCLHGTTILKNPNDTKGRHVMRAMRYARCTITNHIAVLPVGLAKFHFFACERAMIPQQHYSVGTSVSQMNGFWRLINQPF